LAGQAGVDGIGEKEVEAARGREREGFKKANEEAEKEGGQELEGLEMDQAAGLAE